MSFNWLNPIALGALLLIPPMAFSATKAAPSELKYFITRNGDKLMDGDNEFRFIGVNMPGLVVPYDFTLRIPERLVLPTTWEQADGFRSLVQMNARVVRTWNLPMRGPKDGEEMAWAYVQEPGKFNETSFQTLDQTLALANQYGIRVILPLSADAGDYLGGIGTYAAWRNKKRAEFWTDSQLKADYQTTLRYVITRTNTITGVPYRADKAILAWQFGNEMRSAPLAWETEMAAFIKQLDPNHLVIAGNDSRVPTNPPPALDIVTRHYYGGDWVKNCRADRTKAQGLRPLIIGEYGLTADVDEVRRFLDEVVANGTSGALIWSMYFHHRNGGFYWHQIFTHPSLSSYHWPGFSAGAAHNEQPLLTTLREYAYRIQGLPVPPMPVPEPPELLPIGPAPLLTWRGSAGASGYDIERAPTAAGPWNTLAANISDADTVYRPLFNDTNAQPDHEYYYRASARNASGASAPSAPIGPVKFQHACLADELRNFSLSLNHAPGLKLTNDHNALYAEFSFRALGTNGQWITYLTSGDIVTAQVIAWSTNQSATLKLEFSVDGQVWQNSSSQLARETPGRLERELVSKGLKARTQIKYQTTAPRGCRFLKVTWDQPAELDRVEIFHH